MKSHLILAALAFFPAMVFAEDASGIWNAEFDTQIGRQKYSYTLKQDGGKVTGKAAAEARGQTREVEHKDVKVDGDKIFFVEMLNMGGNEIPITYTGTIAGGELKLTRAVGDFAKEDIVARKGEKAMVQAAGKAGENPERGRGRGFGGPIVLGADDKPAFPAPPDGFDKAREGIAHGKVEIVEYDSKSVGTKRKANGRHRAIPPTKNIPCSTCCTALAATRTNGPVAGTRRSFWTTFSLTKKRSP